MLHDWSVWAAAIILGLIAMYMYHSDRPPHQAGMFRRDAAAIRTIRRRC